MGISFVRLYRRGKRRSLASFDRKAVVGVINIARFCGGGVAIAAATAENLVHSVAGATYYPKEIDYL